MSSQPVELDGSVAGPEVLRAALQGSLVSRRPFVLSGFGGHAQGTGLRASDAALLRAAQAISTATLEGAEPSSTEVAFSPGPIRAGDYLLDVGPGAVADAIQTLAPPLSMAEGPSTLKLRGATHVSGRPTWHELLIVWEPAMRGLGFDFGLELRAAGYAPEGGGEANLEVRPGGPVRGLDRRARGTLLEARILSAFSRVPLSVAEAQSERALLRLREHGILAAADNLPLPAPRSTGASCMVLGRFERGASAFSALYDPEAPDRAADQAGTAFCDFMESGGGVSPRQARELLLPLAMAAAGLRGTERPISRFSTSEITEGLDADARVLSRFLDVEIAVLGEVGREGEVRIAPPADGLRARLAERIRHRTDPDSDG